jgi:hypothetical protein
MGILQLLDPKVGKGKSAPMDFQVVVPGKPQEFYRTLFERQGLWV